MIDSRHTGEIFTTQISISDNFNSKIDLQNVRVIQRNLVYIIGVPYRYADENLLRKSEFFGQFGNIKKIVINKRTYAETMDASASVYITFEKDASAEECIIECDESVLDENKTIRCTYGTTKYCSFYLKNIICQNSECMYLHERGMEDDILTKDEMNTNKYKLHKFDGKNKNIHRIGKNEEFKNMLHVLFRYKSKRVYREPNAIRFRPVEETEN